MIRTPSAKPDRNRGNSLLPSQSYIFFAFSAPSAMHWPISHLTNSSEGAKVSTLRRKICSTVLFGQPCIRASIRLRSMFFGPGPTASASGVSRSAPPSFTGFDRCACAVESVQRRHFKIRPAKPQQGHHLSISTMCKAGKLAGLS